MNLGTTVFSQLMEHIDHNEFHRIVKAHLSSQRRMPFSCWDQFLSMAFAQLTYRESLRDIETCLHTLGKKLYHSGIRTRVSRSTLAHANEHRPWQIYRDLALSLIARARVLYQHEHLIVELDAAVYALDATVIELCLALFPWATAAHHIKTTAGLKLHAQLDLQSNLPVFARVTEASVHEIHILDELVLEPGAFYVIDRGYLDFTRLRRIDQAGAFFVIRAKKNLRFERVTSRTVDKPWGLMVDQTIRLVVEPTLQAYPDCIRRIKIRDLQENRSFYFLTNNFVLDGMTISDLHRRRWQVELFFRWIKQHLRIKSFYGTTRNAVNTQIWIALSVFVLVAIVKKELKLEASLYTILQILSVALFEKTPINEVLSDSRFLFENPENPNQLSLFKL
jgi:Transposase DDE domain/Domain of unknown function (DUF4372)